MKRALYRILSGLPDIMKAKVNHHWKAKVTAGVALMFKQQHCMKFQGWHLIAVWPWACHLTSPWLSFFLCKMRVITVVLLHRVAERIKWNNICKKKPSVLCISKIMTYTLAAVSLLLSLKNIILPKRQFNLAQMLLSRRHLCCLLRGSCSSSVFFNALLTHC